MDPAICSLLSGIWGFINQNLLSQILGGFLATLLFWIIFENRINTLFDSREKKKLSKIFLEELLYNRIVATTAITKQTHYANSDEFTFLKYEVNNIDKFLGLEPLNLKKEFYSQARIMSSVLKKDNMLIDIFWFSPNSTVLDKANGKAIFLKNASRNVTSIDKIISDKEFIAEMEKMGLTDQTDA